jgi:hypothetical protein
MALPRIPVYRQQAARGEDDSPNTTESGPLARPPLRLECSCWNYQVLLGQPPPVPLQVRVTLPELST